MLLDDMPEQFKCLIAFRRVDPLEKLVEYEAVVRCLHFDQNIDNSFGLDVVEIVHHTANEP